MSASHSPLAAVPQLVPETHAESLAILKTCIEARAALAALDTAVHCLPRAKDLVHLLVAVEAQSSCAMSGVSALASLRCEAALHLACGSLQTQALGPATAHLVWAEISQAPSQAPVDTAELLPLWQRFLNQATELDPLVRLAIAHYQLRAIQPFVSGNGRTRRVLDLVWLVEAGLLQTPVLCLSRYLLARRNYYEELIAAVATQDLWEDWITFMLTGVAQSARWALARLVAMSQYVEATQGFVARELPKVWSPALMGLVLCRTSCCINDIVEAGIAQRQTASTYLKALADLGVLEEAVVGRDKRFRNVKLMELLAEN